LTASLDTLVIAAYVFASTLRIARSGPQGAVMAWTPLVLSLQAAMFDRLSGCCQVAATSRGVR
jgi:hypothetical protein